MAGEIYASVQLGYKNLAWFNANPNLVLKLGQRVDYLQTGTYKIGDGVTVLSALAFLGGSSGGGTWGSITGTLSNQTDLQTALNAKQATLVSGTNIKSINGVSLLGSGDIIVSGTATLISTYVGVGTGADTLGGSANLTFANQSLLINSAAAGASFKITATTIDYTSSVGAMVVQAVDQYGQVLTLQAPTDFYTGLILTSYKAFGPGGGAMLAGCSFTSNTVNYFGIFNPALSPMFKGYTGGSVEVTNRMYVGGVSSTPTALLQLAAGTSIAGTGPLKMGVVGAALVGTPEIGLWEVDNANRAYYTGASGTRNTIAYLSDVSTPAITAGAVVIGSGSGITEVPTKLFYDTTNNLLYVNGNSGAFANTKLQVYDNVNAFTQVNYQNLSSGTAASTDYVATANNGTDTTNFVNLGINSSAFSDGTFTIGGSLASYLYSNGGNMLLGTSTANAIVMFTGGTLAANERLRINPPTTSGIVGSFVFTPTSNTGQTASTAIVGLSYQASSRTWLSGAIPTQKEISLLATTYNFSGSSTITNAYGLYVEPPIQGTNAIITNNWAAGFNGQIQVTGVNKVTITQPTTSATLTLVTGSSLITAGAFALTLTSTATSNATIPSGTGTLAYLAGANTWTGFSQFNPAARTSGANPAFSITKPNDTNQTASTSISGFRLIGGSRQWATGNIVDQSENDWGQVVYTAVGASVITNAYGNQFSEPLASTNITITNNYAIRANGQLLLATLGRGLCIREGSGGLSGTVTLTGGTATVTGITAMSALYRVFVTGNGTSGSPGYLSVTKNAGSGFTVTSSSPTDTRTVDYFIIIGA